MTDQPPERDALEGLSDAVRAAIGAAEAEAVAAGLGRLGTEHLLLGVLAGSGTIGAAALEAAGIRMAAAQRKVAEAVNPATRQPEARGAGLVWSPRA